MPQKKKKIPERKCVGCGEVKPKKKLVRIVRTPEGGLQLDESGKLSGRGAYICPKKECFEKALKAKRIEKSLETTLSQELCDMIREKLSEVNDDD
ncbi:MAG: YlxR family protein [Clostridiales bacterium]|nr:YlxR family protein [Clostridiales bacterium]